MSFWCNIYESFLKFDILILWSKADFSPLLAFFLTHNRKRNSKSIRPEYWNDQFENVCVWEGSRAKKRGKQNTEGQKWCLSKHVMSLDMSGCLHCCVICYVVKDLQ